jgi:PadR family transcriptional regulator PadR
MSPEFSTDNAKAQMRKGLLEFCVLLIIGDGDAYSSDMLAALKEADLLVVEGTLYPLLSRMKNAGLLSYEWKESKNGPPRKYYALTPAGKKALADLVKTWSSLSDSIISLLTQNGHA